MFKFVHEDEDFKVTLEVTREDMRHDEIAEYFTQFLRGCGYVFDHLAAHRLVDNEGDPLPTFGERYQNIMNSLEKRYEETGSTFPVI